VNGKRAKALNRVRAGKATLQDLARLRRTEPRASQDDIKNQQRASNPPTALTRAVWGMK
jgi:hypothetical protein